MIDYFSSREKVNAATSTNIFLLILLAILLTACTGAITPEIDIDGTVQAALAATLTSQPTSTFTPSPVPTNTPTQTPTSTPTPTLTPTDTPTSQPTATSTSTPTPKPTDTPTSEPTATSTSTPIPPTPTKEPELVVEFRNPHYECRGWVVWTAGRLNNEPVSGYRSFQADFFIKNLSDTPIIPLWEPTSALSTLKIRAIFSDNTLMFRLDDALVHHPS